MRIALGVEYNGSAFSGWQYQKNLRTVQGELEKAISHVANQPIKTICAGRTDKGVHALGQVVHFDTNAERSVRNWLLGINSNLPRDISIHWVKPVTEEFSARFSAQARHYRYLIYNAPTRSALLQDHVTWHLNLLDIEKMHSALVALIGEHDFTSFRGAHCQAASPVRTIHSAKIYARQDIIHIDIVANAFLYHMVRNIVGTLLAIGEGKKTVGWISEVLSAKDRRQAGVTAPPNGLYLVKVYYSDAIEIPENSLANQFLTL